VKIQKKRWPLILLDKPKRIQATRIRKAKYEIFKQFK
jgi:PAB1-binding protein PBP1